MTTHEQVFDEFEQLIDRAGSGARSLFSVYEPLEVAYRQATASREHFSEVTNSTTLARSFIITTHSAR
ncbi:MAG: hypothetical protein ACRDY2_02875 [Acidimicrobiales bacterium]